MEYFLGVDIGASTVKLGFVDERGRIVGERRDYRSHAGDGPRATIGVIREAYTALCEENGIDPGGVRAVGACSPTPIDRRGMCVYPTNIDASWRGVNVREELSTALGLESFLLNDGDAAAYREYAVRAEVGRDSDGMVQLITGTGLGGSLIIHGEVFAGPTVTAELGHVITDTSPSADRCGCGATGCAETRASLTGLTNIVRHLQEAGEVEEELRGEPSQVARRLRALGQVKSPLPGVCSIWREYFTHLGLAARSIANTVGCDLIVISGGAQEREEGAGEREWRAFLDFGLDVVREQLDCSFPHLRDVRVEWAIDQLADSAAYGAAAYARHLVGVNGAKDRGD